MWTCTLCSGEGCSFPRALYPLTERNAIEGQATQNGDATSLHIKLVQSGVSDKFRMPVPLYLELEGGKVMRLGSVNVTGNKTIDQTLQLPKLPAKVKRVSINYYYDVLSTEN
jgi:hypothetical protein